MTMKIKNTGSMRIRLGRTLYLKPNEVLDVPNAEGKIAVRRNTDVINVTPKKPRAKVWIKPTVKDKKLDLNIEVKEDDIK